MLDDLLAKGKALGGKQLPVTGKFHNSFKINMYVHGPQLWLQFNNHQYFTTGTGTCISIQIMLYSITKSNLQ